LNHLVSPDFGGLGDRLGAAAAVKAFWPDLRSETPWPFGNSVSAHSISKPNPLAGLRFCLTMEPLGRIARAHDQRLDHPDRPPPPRIRGMGGRLRLRSSPLPPDPFRGAFLAKHAV
jgi:hypothetical protein